MKNIELLESNYPIVNGNYDTFQCRLPLDFFIVIPIDDPLTSFVEIMKGINTSKYFDCSHRGNKGYDPNTMLQIVLFAFMNGESELRKMEELCKYNIRYMWLSNEETPLSWLSKDLYQRSCLCLSKAFFMMQYKELWNWMMWIRQNYILMVLRLKPMQRKTVLYGRKLFFDTRKKHS